MGGGTLLVSLPKDWARKNGVHKGSTLAVDELSGRKLIVRPIEDTGEKPKEVTIEYPKDDLTHVLNDVTGAYLLGYDIIHIRGGRVVSREDREKLKATISRLIGLEIMYENSKTISMQFLLEPTGINPEKIARRMAGIIEGMLKDTAEAVVEGNDRLLTLVDERDDEVDRLYFLLVRIVRTATMRLEVAESYGLAPVDVLDYRVLASFLESAGDSVAELSKHLLRQKTMPSVAGEYTACIEQLIRLEDLAIRSFLNRKSKKQHRFYEDVNTLADEVSERLAETARLSEAKQPAAMEVLGALERVSRIFVDVSDLAVPSQSLS
jgi:phosphate uptake regulator